VARIEVPMPQMGESIAEGTVSQWLKQVGDAVERDEPILEISTDKVDAEIPAPASGTLVEIAVQEGETVEVGTIVAFIDTEAGVASAASTPEVATTAQAPAPATPPPATQAPEAPGRPRPPHQPRRPPPRRPPRLRSRIQSQPRLRPPNPVPWKSACGHVPLLSSGRSPKSTVSKSRRSLGPVTPAG